MDKKMNKFISKYMPRWFNCFYAFINAYFWLPCPLCHKNFGGHEWFTNNDIDDADGCGGQGICPKCGEIKK